MQEQGKIRHIGLSEVTPAEIEDAEKIVPIVTVQNRYSLADRRHEETLKYCERRGIAFLPWYPMAAGKLLQAGPPASRRGWLRLRRGTERPLRRYRWRGCCRRSPVMLPIPGTSKVAHLEENVAAAELKLSAEDWED